jgi:hypothetical protein
MSLHINGANPPSEEQILAAAAVLAQRYRGRWYWLLNERGAHLAGTVNEVEVSRNKRGKIRGIVLHLVDCRYRCAIDGVGNAWAWVSAGAEVLKVHLSPEEWKR